MKKYILFLFIIIVISTICYASDDLIDIDNHWAKVEIKTLIRDGAVTGYQDNTFRPDNVIRVDEFLKILIDENKMKTCRQGKDWSETYYFAALDHKLVKDNDFDRLDRPLLRIEAAKILANYINLDGVSKAKDAFKDLSKENKDTILRIVKLGVMSGYKDGSFRENNEVTRGQACKIILNAIKSKKELSKTRKFKPNHKNTNIGPAQSGDVVQDIRYKIEKNRLYIYDSGRYSCSDWTTLNQEYLKDDRVIKLINTLVDDLSYTEVMYVPDKYTIDSLNVCYGQREGYVNNGSYSFSFRFYENSYYNAAKANDIDEFTDKACILIQIDRMWDTLSEFDKVNSMSDYRKYKLEEAIGTILDKSVKKEFINYIEDKILESKILENNDFEPKIAEVKKIGKYTINTLCIRDSKLYIYIEKF